MQIHKTYIASFVVLAAIGGAVVYSLVNGDENSTITISADVPVGTASLSVKPNKFENVKVGQTFSVDVMLSTGKDRTTGVDVALRYDPVVLEVVDADGAAAGTQVTDGKLFDFVPANDVVSAAGQINFSASQQPVSEPKSITDGKLVSVTFKAKTAGSSVIRFDHTPGLLNDSNVIKPDDGRDLLSRVSDGSVTVTE